MSNSTRLLTLAIAVIAGVFLLISGIRGPTGTYELIIEQLPNFIQDPQILQIASTLALILITISLAGGLAVIAGGILLTEKQHYSHGHSVKILLLHIEEK
jgi:hypothetical protein